MKPGQGGHEKQALKATRLKMEPIVIWMTLDHEKIYHNLAITEYYCVIYSYFSIFINHVRSIQRDCCLLMIPRMYSWLSLAHSHVSNLWVMVFFCPCAFFPCLFFLSWPWVLFILSQVHVHISVKVCPMFRLWVTQALSVHNKASH